MQENKIQLLPEDLINKIAAGEVIERPASVVKELVENSIDANATHIEIEIQDAGKKLIRVTDDGNGMTDEDIELAIKRHSTSKIKNLDDLFNIKTLGFRGEALPSIASVSKFEIKQNPNGKGISAYVKELFYNTPVRLKFLKTNYTELTNIKDIVSSFILSRPNIAFKLIIDSKVVSSSNGSGKLIDAIYTVYGLELSKELLEVKSDPVYGYISKPNLSRIDRNFEVFFVNGRIVKNFILSRALEEAYRNLIPNNRYPVSIVFINIPASEVDVNVHPSKKEVKFIKTKEITDTLIKAVKDTLLKVFEDKGLTETYDKNSFDSLLITPNKENNNSFYDNKYWLPKTAEVKVLESVEFEVLDVQPLIPLHQFIETYIICTDGKDIVLIDQHAAHERILFDKLQKTIDSLLSSSQTLLIPETINLGKAEASVLDENLEEFKKLGFEIESFGKDSFIVRAIPSVLRGAFPKETIIDIISEFKEGEFKNQPEKQRDKINKIIACRGAIKAGDKLSTLEINNLIKDLYKTENPLTCPHGRPTMVRIGKDALEKMFGRK